MRVTTPLAPDTLLLERLEVRDTVSKQFEIDLRLLSEDGTIDAKKLLRQPMTVTVMTRAGDKRFFNGFVRRFTQLGRHPGGLVSYRAELVPATWFLSLSSDCRIYQQKTVVDIVKAVFADTGITDVKYALTGTYQPREYCVQYRETHLDFVSRLMEEEGIFYFFEHQDGKHFLVLADAPSAVKPGVTPKLKVHSDNPLSDDDYITDLEVESEVVAGKVTLLDYNDTITKSLEGSVGSPAGSSANLLQFDYPGKFAAKGEGDRLARLRLEEAEAFGKVIHCATTSPSVGSGQKLDIADFYRNDINGSYHILSSTHSAEEGAYRSGHGGQFTYVASFQAIPHAVPFRPPRITPRSVVHGTQTAVVVGRAGDEIYADKFGRVKVQFFWDRVGKKDEKSSCWVRVASTWAGKQWGAVSLPRVGQEVVVDFLEGDPDRPIIVGSVYNSEQMPPYALPDNMSQSGVKTRSTKQGTTEHFNELRFEDKLDSEMIFLHAQKDLTTEVENDATHTVGNNETVAIKGNRTALVEKDEEVTVKMNRTAVVEKDETMTVKGNQSVTIKEGNSSFKVSQGKLDTSVDQGNVTLKAGMGSIKYEAMQAIEIKVGPSSIKIDQSGVTIKGVKVMVQGEAVTEVKAPMTTVKADGILTMKGSMTMIN
ncbi:MAG TPA: type VI secretion system tip protein TssI/VgrG [Gemmatimonadaceae bacterium]|jgi:type VI secretion system secreted protein VgrG